MHENISTTLHRLPCFAPALLCDLYIAALYIAIKRIDKRPRQERKTAPIGTFYFFTLFFYFIFLLVVHLKAIFCSQKTDCVCGMFASRFCLAGSVSEVQASPIGAFKYVFPAI